MKWLKKIGSIGCLWFLVGSILVGCTSGQLKYMTPEGEIKTACETEYSWAPSIDHYAVEYVLSYCAKKAAEQGNTVLDKRLLTLDTSLPKPPKGQSWSHVLAKKHYDQKLLSDKEYGYLIAHLSLGL